MRPAEATNMEAWMPEAVKAVHPDARLLTAEFQLEEIFQQDGGFILCIYCQKELLFRSVSVFYFEVQNCVAVSNIFCFDPYLGKVPILNNISQRG